MSKIHETKEKYYLTFYGIHDDNAPDIVFTITNQGTTNYTSVPTITITPATAGLGTGMTATCVLTAGKVTSIILLNKGYGYAGGTLNVAVAGGGGAGATVTCVLNYRKGYTKTLENLTAFDNCKRYRFELSGQYSNIRLGYNAKVAVDYVAVPRSTYATTTTFKYVRICGVSDNAYDTERKGNNNPIIHINKANNLLTDITFFKESRAFRVSPDFLSKGYIEFETGVLCTADLTAHIRFFDQDFVVSIVVYEEDFEQSNDSLLAPPATNQPPNKYFNNYYPNYNNT
jgi:hypothetical protein